MVKRTNSSANSYGNTKFDCHLEAHEKSCRNKVLIQETCPGLKKNGGPGTCVSSKTIGGSIPVSNEKRSWAISEEY